MGTPDVPNFPRPTAEELRRQPIDLRWLSIQAPGKELREIMGKILHAHRGKRVLPLGDVSFGCLAADPEVSQLEERPGMKDLIARIQTCFVLEAYDLLCEHKGISRLQVRIHAEQITGPIVHGLVEELYGTDVP